MLVEEDVVQEDADKEGEGDMTTIKMAEEDIKDHGMPALSFRCFNFLTSLDLVRLIVKQES